ncbi:MAG TPA: class I SAM-dependent methyltransferase [Candidatus Limnocylindria bacterium]|nr:class I SAM-dependent methyltransferase [Candidatus Limnocylindria bacterium]
MPGPRTTPLHALPESPLSRDPHALYEASVLNVSVDLARFARIYRSAHGRGFKTLREDFCGTAALTCAWARRRPDHRALGVDLDPEVLDWGRRHHVTRLGAAAERVTLRQGDVRAVRGPHVDVVAALNFSYWVFHERDALRDYFRNVHRSLTPGGMLFLDAFGGHAAMGTLEERRRISATNALDGLRMPSFTYVWQQARFNPVDHGLRCYIHFRLGDGTWLKRAFRYDWRLWTLPEIQELMREAGFSSSALYVEGWDERAHESNGRYLPRRRFENQEGWLAYVVGRR